MKIDQPEIQELDLIDTTKLTQLTGIAERTWEKWRRTGDGPPFYFISQRCVRYSKAKVLKWFENFERKGGDS